MLAQHVADPAALVLAGEAEAREQLPLLDDRLGAGDLPAHGEALEQELAAALPRVLLRERAAAQRGLVLESRARRHRTAQGEHVAVGIAVLGLGRARLL